MTAAAPSETQAVQALAAQTDGFHLVIDALKLNGIDTIFGPPGIPIPPPPPQDPPAGNRVIPLPPAPHARTPAAAATRPDAVSYTHLTLPTNREVEIWVVAVPLKKHKLCKN